MSKQVFDLVHDHLGVRVRAKTQAQQLAYALRLSHSCCDDDWVNATLQTYGAAVVHGDGQEIPAMPGTYFVPASNQVCRRDVNPAWAALQADPSLAEAAQDASLWDPWVDEWVTV